MIQIPYDLYESPEEFVLIIPLWGVKKDSIILNLKDYQLTLTAWRYKPNIKDDLVSLEQNCYWGEIKTKIDLPPNIYFKDIHTTLSPENILTIIIPKNIEPEKLSVDIQYS